MNNLKQLLILTGCIFLSACKPTLNPSMALPQQLKNGQLQTAKYTQTIEFSTIVPRATGTFQLGQWSGTFERSAYGFSMTDSMHDKRDFSASIRVSKANSEDVVNVNCNFVLSESAGDTVDISSDKRSAYQCQYVSESSNKAGTLVLGQTARAGFDRNANHLRVGTSSFSGSDLDIESKHTSPDLMMRLDDPLGFVFNSPHGSVAAIDLRQRKFRLRQDVSEDTQRNAVYAALALIMRNRPQD